MFAIDSHVLICTVFCYFRLTAIRIYLSLWCTACDSVISDFTIIITIIIIIVITTIIIVVFLVLLRSLNESIKF